MVTAATGGHADAGRKTRFLARRTALPAILRGVDDSLPLIRRARSGDASARESLLLLHLPGLRGFLENRAGELIRNRESLSDLVQSTCREVLEDLPGVDCENEVHFKHWLYQAALRKVVDKARFWRAEKRDPRREAEAAPRDDETLVSEVYAALGDDLGTPSQAAMGREEIARIETALARLPREQRNVILMAKFLGLAHAEIAKELGKSEGSVRVLLFRSLAALREQLGIPGPGAD